MPVWFRKCHRRAGLRWQSRKKRESGTCIFTYIIEKYCCLHPSGLCSAFPETDETKVKCGIRRYYFLYNKDQMDILFLKVKRVLGRPVKVLFCLSVILLSCHFYDSEVCANVKLYSVVKKRFWKFLCMSLWLLCQWVLTSSLYLFFVYQWSQNPWQRILILC